MFVLALSTPCTKLTRCAAMMRPQILIFMLPEKAAFQYLRIKKSADCRYGVVSQCVQNLHVQKCQPQYLSNVLMKFNAKLGGTTAKVASVSARDCSKIVTLGLLTGLAETPPWPLPQADTYYRC